MCVLQDFEALTPNLLARTIETVEGILILILILILLLFLILILILILILTLTLTLTLTWTLTLILIGGGIVIILLKTVKSLKQLYTLSMDVHNRYRTEAHHEVMPRFNERFILSLGGCDECLVLDDELNVLPISSKADHIPSYEGSFEGREDGDAGN